MNTASEYLQTPPPSNLHLDKDEHPQIVRSDELLQGRRELWIEHGEDMYRLRVTSSGKLYLTK